MSLIFHDTISLTTASGVSKIQLCIGDITKLPKEEQADVLVVSAFPGDYSPTPSSLIGALAINLGISVRNLSKDKEEDLRRQYFCWWSRPLPEEHSFRRILCFEGGFGRRGSTPPKVVGAVFRCLVPILSGEDSKGGSVIMPLLASGDQGYSKQLMLRLIIDSAIHWIKAGLELKTLKIVLFSRHPERHDKSHEPLFECFQKMKDQYGDKELTYETEIVYDVYMSHSPKDHDSALQIAKFLRTEKQIRVFQDFQELNDNESWQEEIFDIMGKCARVIALLSPGYLETESCIEQYNMALCINRRSHGTVLAPFYITSIDYMPTYMSLIQYEDCRPKDKRKLQAASNDVADSLKKTQEQVSSSVPTTTSKTSGYDVFISYSHQNKTHASKVLETLKSLAPDLRIFIDTAGLNTGTSWQQILYNALDASSSTMVLLSPDYIKSKVCYEEFCLSHALFVDKHRSMDLVSLLVEPVQELPLWCQQPLPADCVSSHVDTDQVLSSACVDLVNRLKGTNNTADDILTQRVQGLKEEDLTIELAMDNYRKSCFVLRSGVLKTPVDFTSSTDKETLRASHASDVVMSVDGHHVGVDSETSQVTSSNSTSVQVTPSRPVTCDVALSYAEGDKREAVTLKQLLLEEVPSLKISEPMAGDFSRVQSLDVARVIVLLLSPAFLASSELVEELNIAIFRNRSASRRILFPVQIATYPPKPSYVHLIPCEFSNSDYPWAHKIVDQNLQREVSLLAQRNLIDVDEAFCLKNAATAICERLLEESKPVLNPVNRVLLNVHVIEEGWKQVKMALQQEQGLESWKRTFEIKINSMESDLKPARIFERDDVMPDVETQLVIADENESGGVELHLRDITNNEQNSAAGTDNRDQSRKLTKDHSLENESNKAERSVRFEDELTEEQLDAVTADNQPRSLEPEGEASTKDSKACSLL